MIYRPGRRPAGPPEGRRSRPSSGTRPGPASARPGQALVKRLAAVMSAAALVVSGLGLATVAAQQPPIGAGPLAGFSLVHAGEHYLVASLEEGAQVALPDPDASYGFRADIVAGQSVASVRLELSGAKSPPVKTENYAPYSLYGDYPAGPGRRLHGETLPAGDYVLRASAFSQRRLGGELLGSLEVSFSVVESDPEAPLVKAPTDLAADWTGRSVRLSWVVPHQPDLCYRVSSGTMCVNDMYLERSGPDGQWQTATWLSSRWVDLNTGEAQYHANLSHHAAGEVNRYRVRLDASLHDGARWNRLDDVYSEPVAIAVPPRVAITLNAEARHDQVALSWTMPQPGRSDWERLTTMELLRDGSVIDTQQWQSRTLSYSHTDGDVEPETTYEYRVRTVIGDDKTTSPAVPATTGAVPVSVFDQLAGGSGAAVEKGTTVDGVPYVRFLEPEDPPAPLPEQPSVSLMLGDGAAPQQWSAVAAGWPGSGVTTSDATISAVDPQTVHSDGTTIWVLLRNPSADVNMKLQAYALATGARDAAKDITLAAPATTGTSYGAGLWMDGSTIWTTDGITKSVLAYHRTTDTADPATFNAGDRKTSHDFDLSAQSPRTPAGLWSDGTNMYIADMHVEKRGHRYSSPRIYVYDMDSRDHVRTLPTTDGHHPGNWTFYPTGLWSDGATLWVTNRWDGTAVDAYDLNDWGRRPGLDITGLSGDNSGPQGIWSDGVHMWVADRNADKVFVYDLPDDARLGSLEVSDVNLRDFSPDLAGYARNVAGDTTRVTVDAAALRRDAAVGITPADADTLTGGHQVDIVANGVTAITVTVTDGAEEQVYTVALTQLAGTTGTLSDDTALSELSLSGLVLLPPFRSGTTEYMHWMTDEQIAEGLTTTVTATPRHSGATVHITPDDADGATTDHELEAEGAGVFLAVAVTAQDGSATQTYTVHLRGIGRDDTKDLLSIESDHSPYDIWSDGETLWVLSSGEPELLAHNLKTGSRIEDRDFKRTDEYNDQDMGLWSDGDMMWISETWATESYVYPPKPGQDMLVEVIDAQSYDPVVHLTGEFFLDLTHYGPGARDLWSDGETIWVAWIDDDDSSVQMHEGRLKAYDFETKARKESADIVVDSTGEAVRVWYRDMSFAVWSDGTFMWVALNRGDETSVLEAYSLAGGERVPVMDIPVGLDQVRSPRGLWSDGRNMWVLDAPFLASERKIRKSVKVYSLPPNAKLFSLAMSDVDFGHFIHGKPGYTAEVANSVDVTTVSWEQAFTGGSAAVAVRAVDGDGGDSTADADGVTDGYQVNLAEGENVITITVTAPNGTDTYAYTVTITRAGD